MNKVKYSLWLEDKLTELKASGTRPTLLLHACCAPCSSYVLEYLAEYFDITVFFYNPNISPKSEYIFRAEELQRLLSQMPLKSEVKLIVEDYVPEEFEKISRGKEDLEEGGARCYDCYSLRLNATAKKAASLGTDFFCTTLSISPYKNAEWLNEIGKQCADTYGVGYLFSDFKKKNGYKRSCDLSKIFSLYRQDYCGCIFSKEAAEKRNIQKRELKQEQR